MSDQPISERSQRSPLWPWVYLVAAIYVVLHLATSTRYGYFRDALYYLACSEHLAFGYVDQPPLIAFLGWIARHTLGASLPALLLWPALAGAARVILIALFARELGAKAFGVVLAAVLAVTPAVWWIIDHQFAMNVFDTLLWTSCAYVILKLIKTQDPRLWLLFGLFAGTGLENKYSIAIFAGALIIGLLLSRERKILFTPWLLLGGVVALLIFLPNLIWNIQHHWPFLELMRNVRATGKDIILPPGKYLLQQILMMNPASFPFWFGGLLLYFLSPAAKRYRVFGCAFVITIAFFMLTHGKDYYSAPAYAMLLAGGAVAAERVLDWLKMRGSTAWQRILKPACFAWLMLGVGLLLPRVLPILPIDAYIRYQTYLPIEGAKTERSFIGAKLPQYYADEFNWPEMVEKVARIYQSLSPDEQARTAIFCHNYGDAAAIDFFGGKYGLPKAISGHQNYFLWGPRNYTGEIVILIGEKEEDVRKEFESVTVAATQNNPYAMWYQTQPILLCRGLKWNLQTGWPTVKNWR